MAGKTTLPSSNYVGRFAPSPSGPLHFGSLVSALASYLDAKSSQGLWLVRMEDLDPPREVPGAADQILRSLEAHGLHWDGEVLYQSQRSAEYLETIQYLQQQSLLYPCYCTRKEIAARGGIYSGTCRTNTHANITTKTYESQVHESRVREVKNPSEKAAALRLKVSELPDNFKNISTSNSFPDIFLGSQQTDLKIETGDFIVRRKDKLFAYQLAVVVDDISQGISHVVRGRDLLGSTAPQLFLFQLLQAPPPLFGHLPLATNDRGQKLSKQHGAKALDNNKANENILQAMIFLNQPLPGTSDRLELSELLEWARKNWDRSRVPKFIGAPVHEHY